MSTLNVLISGGGGRIAYSLIPKILNGDVFGKNTRINLRLLDIEAASSVLKGVKYEIDDSCFELLNELICSSDLEITCRNADVAILLGGYPRLPGMERGELISKNAEGMKRQAEALNTFASKNCKVLVVANPANTNCLVAIQACPTIPSSNFSCLTRLDEERFRHLVCEKLNQFYSNQTSPSSLLLPSNIHNICIFGNHSSTQVPYLHSGTYTTNNSDKEESFPPEAFHQHPNEYQSMVKHIQTRGAQILDKLKNSSAMSAAVAIEKHLIDWLGPREKQGVFSMGILSDGSIYDVPNNIVFSFPCRRKLNGQPGEIEIVKDLVLPANVVDLMKITIQELLSERDSAKDYLCRS